MRKILFQIILVFACLNTYATDELILGPYIMDTQSQIETPEGYTRVMVWSEPSYSGGSISLQFSEGGGFTIIGSTSYRNQWMYFIKSGTYTVTETLDTYNTTVNGQRVSEGSSVTFGGGGYILFSPKE